MTKPVVNPSSVTMDILLNKHAAASLATPEGYTNKEFTIVYNLL